MTMLEICRKEIGSVMASLASLDLEEVSKQMEESEFALLDDLESELRFSSIILKIFYVSNIFYFSCREDEEKRRRRALKTTDDDGLHDDDDVSPTQVWSGQCYNGAPLQVPSQQSIKRQSQLLVSAKQTNQPGTLGLRDSDRRRRR